MDTESASPARPLPGKRAQKLDEVLERALSTTLRTACSYEKLASCFPTLAARDPETLRHAGEQVVSFMGGSCRSEFGKILDERCVVERLNELDRLLEKARAEKESGASGSGEGVADLSPEHLLRAHLLPLKRDELASLQAKLQVLQASNASELEAVESARKSLDAATTALKQQLGTIDRAVEAANAMATS
ncbi:hypothetical protein PYCC9005_004752 [Savitreella phatthalungensis]